MEENNDIPRLSPSEVQKLKMNPPDNAWNRLDAELSRKQALLSEKRANRFKLLFMLTGLLLLCSVTYFFFAPSKIKSVASIENKKVLPFVNSDSNNSGYTTNSMNNTDNITASKVIKNEAANNTSAIVNSTSNNITSTTSLAKNKEPNKQEVLAKRNDKGATAIDDKIKQPRIKAIALQSKSKKASGQKTATHNVNQAPVAVNNATVSANKVTDAPETIQTSSSDAVTTTEQIPASTESKTNITVQQPVNNPSSSAPIIQAPITAKEVVDSTPEATEQVAGIQPATKTTGPGIINTPTTVKPKSILSRLSVAAVFSPEYSKNHLTETPQSKVSAKEYSSREKTKFAYGAGLLVRFDLNNKWSISSGATYSIMSYSITLPTIYAYTNSSNQLVYMYPTSCGLVEIPNTIQATATYKGESLNTAAGCAQVVRFINVPLTVRYQVPLKRFTAYINAGVEANFVAREKSNICINGNETTIVNNIDGLKKMNFGYIAGIGLQYNIFKRMGVFAEAQYKGSVNSLTQNTIVNCYPYSWVGNIGLSFHF